MSESGANFPAVQVENVSLRYRVTQERVGSVKEYVIRRIKRNLVFSDFWALRDISFEVPPGEVFGIIGRNGAGKTTLLRVIARVLQPSSGRVVVRGLTAPLLGLGAGFNSELTGRENVFLGGATLGFSFREMQEKFDSIVDFSGLSDFIDAPFRTYSSGMAARLGFAVATDVQPDVLLLDEVMAVGDIEFKEKCEERISDFQRKGATTIMVSHDLQTILDLCDQAMLLNYGEMAVTGSPDDVVNRYKEGFAPAAAETAG
jgi:ABC-2 type transport system ATP-binding protein/lipopolysaccharide transport system ATP-binding protein